MFTWLKGLFSEKRRHPLTYLPSFFMEIDPVSENIMITSGWPKPNNEDEFANIIKGFITLLRLLDNGKLTPICQHAISVYGENHNDQHTAQAILINYNTNLKQKDTPQVEEDQHKGVIPPTSVFHRG